MIVAKHYTKLAPATTRHYTRPSSLQQGCGTGVELGTASTLGALLFG
jgi:hypothetical protein